MEPKPSSGADDDLEDLVFELTEDVLELAMLEMDDLPDTPRGRLIPMLPPRESSVFTLGFAFIDVGAGKDLEVLLLGLVEGDLELVLLDMANLSDTPKGRLTLRPPLREAPILTVGLGLGFEDESIAAFPSQAAAAKRAVAVRMCQKTRPIMSAHVEAI
jgi:hypothetical protein